MSVPPSKAELIGYTGFVTDLDDRYVIKHFLGKTQEEARRMYPSGGTLLTEDFTYMASDGLRYYLPPALDYLCDVESDHDQEFCQGLLCSLSCQVRFHRLAADVLLLIKDIAAYCDSNRAKFGLDGQEDLFDEYVRKIRAA